MRYITFVLSVFLALLSPLYATEIEFDFFYGEPNSRGSISDSGVAKDKSHKEFKQIAFKHAVAISIKEEVPCDGVIEDIKAWFIFSREKFQFPGFSHMATTDIPVFVQSLIQTFKLLYF